MHERASQVFTGRPVNPCCAGPRWLVREDGCQGGVVSLPEPWRGLVDDATVFPPGDAPLDEALDAYVARRGEWYAGLVGSFVVTDAALPDVTEDVPVSVVVTGGAGAIAGALRLAAKHDVSVAGIEIALRDLDDLAGNARRVLAAVDAAREDGALV